MNLTNILTVQTSHLFFHRLTAICSDRQRFRCCEATGFYEPTSYSLHDQRQAAWREKTEVGTAHLSVSLSTQFISLFLSPYLSNLFIYLYLSIFLSVCIYLYLSIPLTSSLLFLLRCGEIRHCISLCTYVLCVKPLNSGTVTEILSEPSFRYRIYSQ